MLAVNAPGPAPDLELVSFPDVDPNVNETTCTAITAYMNNLLVFPVGGEEARESKNKWRMQCRHLDDLDSLVNGCANKESASIVWCVSRPARERQGRLYGVRCTCT